MSRILTSNASDCLPDWKVLWTPEEAERELGNIFENQKQIDGWHITKTDTLLVIPSQTEGRYWFWVYNDRNPADAFNAIVNACVRRDDR